MASMRNASMRRYASAIAGPSVLTRARFWTSSVQCAVISTSTPSGCWGASLSNQHDVLDGLRNITTCAADGIAQAMACHRSDVQQAAGGAMPRWLLQEVCFGGLEESARAKLAGDFARSIDRWLKPIRVQHPKGLSGTKPGTLLEHQIPIRTMHWDITLPDVMEADTVPHCGNSLAGDFVWSLTLSDILTGWTECRATWNKGSSGVLDQIKEIEQALPFRLRGFDCDIGSVFLNHHLLRYFSSHPAKPAFTRSRPYQKNDNAHVEQKNWTHVQQLFGYERFDNPEPTKLMNTLYAKEWSQLQNHFCPTLKLKQKERIGARYRKRYHTPETPFQHVMNCESRWALLPTAPLLKS